jgi:predicted amino acid dehydrogenase
MKKVVSVSLGSKSLDYQFEAELWGERFHIRRVGTDGDTGLARRLVGEHDGQVDAIALGGMAISFNVGDRCWRHKETYKIARQAKSTPVVGGRALRKIVDRWAIRQIARRHPELFNERNVLFLSGIANSDVISVMRNYTDAMVFADPVLHFGAPMMLRSAEALAVYARAAMPILTRRPYVSFFPRGRAAEGIQVRELVRHVQRADVVVGDLRMLMHYLPDDLAHKVLVTDSIGEEELSVFRARGAEVICTTAPQVFGDKKADLQILHALCIAHLDKDFRSIDEQDYLQLISELKAHPRVIHPRGEVKRRHKFAFLYYPPGRRDLFRRPRLRWIRTAPEALQVAVEKAMALSPIRPFAHVRGVVSPTGEEAEGWILHMPVTAEAVADKGVDYAADRLAEASKIAARLGAQILGVGAFAREMTEATEQVAARAEIPITSGASYLVSADMWAAKVALMSLGQVEVDEAGRALGTAMVLGAGSANGSVAAELLGMAFHRLVVVDREPDRLLDLVDRIQQRNAHCTVEVSTKVGSHLPEADLVVTGLAPGWTGTIDLRGAVKSGAVVLDCLRPPEFDEADADSRPDVLFVRAGEVELPGPVDISVRLGPPQKVAFASMAEAVVLALEGRYECFSLGDSVEFDQVRDIYRLGLKHGMQLAGMRGPFGKVGETAVKLVRERVAARKRLEEAPPPLETIGETP